MSGPAEELTALLRRERAALAAGDLAALAAMAARKEALADALVKAPTASPEAARRLQQELARTAPLLRAALHGVRAARSRLGASRRGADARLERRA